MSAIGLYYPYIHFQDDLWVKQAALYWDKVARIVPAGYDGLHDSTLVSRLRDELDLVSNYEPEWPTVRAVSEELIELIQEHEGALRERFDPAVHLESSTDSLAYLYHTKMDHQLVRVLQESGLGTYRRVGGEADHAWLGVHPRIGQVFMTALASEMARRGALEVVSDNERFAVAGCGFPLKQQFANLVDGDGGAALPVGETVEGMLGVAAIECVLPANLEVLTVEEIANFREDTIEERAAYRKAIGSLAVDVEGVSSEAALVDHVQTKGAEIGAAVKKLEGKMNGLLGDTVIDAFGVSKDLPDLFKHALGSIGIGLANPWIAAGGYALALVKSVREKRGEMQDLKENPYAYLVTAKERLGRESTLARIVGGARRLVLG